MISVIVALYNEAARFPENHPRLVEYLGTLGEEWELILVDDGSRDGTRDMIAELARSDARVRALGLERNLGQGAAVKLGLLASRGEVALYTDADLSVPLPHFSELLARVRAGAAVAVGSRWARGARIRMRQPFPRRWLGRVYYALVRALFLGDLSDCNCGLKAYRAREARVLFGFVRSWRWAFNIEHLWLARRLGWRVEEVPVEWSHRPESKVHLVRDGLFTLWELGGILARRAAGVYPRWRPL